MFNPSIGRQRSELKDPISFPQFPPFPAVVTIFYLFYPHHPQIFMGVVWLVEVCSHWFSSFFVVMSDRWPFILICRAFSVSSTYCMLHLSQLIMYTMMVYLLPVVLLVKVLVLFISSQVLHRLLLQGALSPGVGGVGVFYLCSN